MADPVAAIEETLALAELPEEGASPALAALRQTWTRERTRIQGELDEALQRSLQALESEMTRARDFAKAKEVLAFRESLAPTPDPALVPVPVPATGALAPTPAPVPATGVSAALASATKDKPFENSLGMKFVPVPIRGGPTNRQTVLFSVWETRVEDYQEFVKDTGRSWQKADFPQKDDHPAVYVSWEDAVAFCEWLTEEDRKKRKIGKDQRYRLPTDHEWSCAVGIGKDEDADLMPSAKSGKLPDVFPWGRDWPPPKGAGNYYGEETKKNPVSDASRIPIEGYEDPFDRTGPVGSFEPNEYGLYDLSGNVYEWCEDWVDSTKENRVLRGGSWNGHGRGGLLSSCRGRGTPTYRISISGFRVVVVVSSSGR
jgi:hypothetical protein